MALFIAGRSSVYLAVGYWLQVRHGFIIGDALSRVFAAQSVLFSRDPHLAAIGFIFTPLTAMVQLPCDRGEPAVAADDRAGVLGHDHVVNLHGGGGDSDPRRSAPTEVCRGGIR